MAASGCVWLYLVVFGCIWLIWVFMLVHGGVCKYMVVYACIWLYLAVFGCIWWYTVDMAASGGIWLYMVVYGCVWLFVAVFVCTQVSMAAPPIARTTTRPALGIEETIYIKTTRPTFEQYLHFPFICCPGLKGSALPADPKHEKC